VYELVGIGNPVYDIIQTPVISRGDRILSGCSTNACLAARKLGLDPVALIGNLGADFEARFAADLLRYGIRGYIPTGSGQTGGFKLVYDQMGDRTLDVLGVADKIRIEDIPSEFLDANCILLGPILGEIDASFVGQLRKSSGAQILLDPQGLLRSVDNMGRVHHRAEQSQMKSMMRLVNVVKPNELEARIMTGIDDPVKSVMTIQSWGAHVAIVTLAERGSLIHDGSRLIRIPAFKTTVIDPTGAGDVYGGSFVTEYMMSKDLAKAGLFASAAASVMVENVGPDFPLDEWTVRKRMKTIESLVVEERLG
jgi:sugar/nucleoside kinase (ribokinase family)